MGLQFSRASYCTYFSLAAFYEFAKLIRSATPTRSLLRPATEFIIEVNADAANAILILDRSCSPGIVLRGVWGLHHHRYRQWERARCPLHHHTACESICDRRADRHLQCRCFWYGTSHLSVAEKQCHHPRRCVIELYNTAYSNRGIPRNVQSNGRKQRGRCL